MTRVLIIPAAGTGSRLGAGGPKLLARVGGQPMLDLLLALYGPHVDRVVLVVQPSADAQVRAHLGGRRFVEVVWQPCPTGMLDALLLAAPTVRAHEPDWVWITWCDQVAVAPATLARLAARTTEPGLDVAYATAVGPAPYTCLVRDASGRLTDILHRREGDAMPAWGESEMGVFALSRRAYFEWLPRFADEPVPGAATGERNFLPFLPWAEARGRGAAVPCDDAREAVGVNTPEDRALVEAFLRERRRTGQGGRA